MPSYTVVIKFNSPVNASTFHDAYPQFNPQSVNITSGFDPTAPTSDSLIQIFPVNPTGTNPSFISITVPSLDAIPFNYQPLLTFDNNNQVYVQVSPSINVSELNINTTNNTPIFQNGVPTPDYIIQTQTGPPPSSTLGFDYNPIYDNPDLRRIVPAVPPSQEQQNIELQLEIQRLLNQLTPNQGQPPVPATPQSIEQQIIQFNLQQQNLLDQLNQYFNPTTDQPPVPYNRQPFQPLTPEQQQQLQQIADYPLDPNVMRAPELNQFPYIEPQTPPDPRNAFPDLTNPNALPDPYQPPPELVDPFIPGVNPFNPGLGEGEVQGPLKFDPFADPSMVVPYKSTPDIMERLPPTRIPRDKTKTTPISDSGEGGGSLLQQSYWIVVGPSFTNSKGTATSYGTGTTISIPFGSAVSNFLITTVNIVWTSVNIVSSGKLPPGPIVFSGTNSSGTMNLTGQWCGQQTDNSFNTPGGDTFRSIVPLTSSGSSSLDFVWNGTTPLPGTGTAASNDPTSVFYIPPPPQSTLNTDWFALPLAATWNFFGDAITSTAQYNSLVGPGNTLFALTTGRDISVANPATPNIVQAVNYDTSTISATSTGGGLTVTYKAVAAARRNLAGDIVFLFQGGVNTILV